MSVIVRPMTIADLPAVVAIEKRSFPTPWSFWLFFQEILSPQRCYVVAEEAGRVVGYAGMSYVLDEGHVTTLAVDPSRRRRGIGQRLLNELVDTALRLGLAFLTLEVRESNEVAQALYRKTGFVVEGRRKDYYFSPREDAIIMTLHLDTSPFRAEQNA
jgi:ribosomal-protein-alanine N-acetyltransferase